jgi:ferredoxin
MRWGMVINLNKCIGCDTCVIKCIQEHFLPNGVLWSRTLMSETGKYPRVKKHVYPVLCNHIPSSTPPKVHANTTMPTKVGYTVLRTNLPPYRTIPPTSSGSGEDSLFIPTKYRGGKLCTHLTMAGGLR